MPAKDGYRLDDDERLLPVRPGSRQKKPEGSIRLPNSRPPVLSMKNSERLAESEVSSAGSERSLRAVRFRESSRRIASIMAGKCRAPRRGKLTVSTRPGFWPRAVPGRTVHDFRRTAVRRLEHAGISRSVAMKLTGHKTESIYRRYAIVPKNDLEEVARRLDEAASKSAGQVLSAGRTAKGSQSIDFDHLDGL